LLALTPVLIFVLQRIIKAEMSSLRTLAEIIDTQNEECLSALPTSRVPDEFAPFIHAINRLLQRIGLMNESQPLYSRCRA